MAEIILTFEWDGKTVHKETKGYVGPDCVTETRFIEEGLGKVEGRRYKSEYYNEQGDEIRDRLRYQGD